MKLKIMEEVLTLTQRENTHLIFCNSQSNNQNGQ